VVSAVSFAERGFSVIAFDTGEECIRDLSAGRLSFGEPGVAEALAANDLELRFTSDARDLEAVDVAFISQDVPTDSHGRSSLERIYALVELVGRFRGANTVVVILSQVPPGFTSGITAIAHQFLFYQVETLVFGEALSRARRPERFIVGASDADRPLPDSFLKVLKAFSCPILVMNYESAELAKIAINLMLVSSISSANMLSELSEALGANWDSVSEALRADRRIGQFAYLQPGLGLGGGNLLRDLHSFSRKGAEYGIDTSLVRTWMDQSQRRRLIAARLVEDALEAVQGPGRLAVWGLAYKANTASVQNSPALELIESLSAKTCVSVHDPLVDAADVLGGRVRTCATPLEAAADADVLAVLTPWPMYRNIPAESVLDCMRGGGVIDPFSILKGWERVKGTFTCYRLGQPILRGVQRGTSE